MASTGEMGLQTSHPSVICCSALDCLLTTGHFFSPRRVGCPPFNQNLPKTNVMELEEVDVGTEEACDSPQCTVALECPYSPDGVLMPALAGRKEQLLFLCLYSLGSKLGLLCEEMTLVTCLLDFLL